LSDVFGFLIETIPTDFSSKSSQNRQNLKEYSLCFFVNKTSKINKFEQGIADAFQK